MATVETEMNHEPTLLPFTGPRVRKELVTSKELRRRIEDAGSISIRYRAGPKWVGHVVVPKVEVLRRLDEYPDDAIHHLEPYRNGIILGA